MTKRSASSGSKRTARWFALGGIVGPLLLILGTMIGGALRPGYSHVRDAMSDLGVGLNPWILNVPLVLCGLLMTAMAMAFHSLLPELKNHRSAGIMLGLFGLLYASAGIFHEPDSNPPLLLTEFLHFFLAMFIAMPLLITTLFMIGSQLRKNSPWHGYGVYTTASAWLMIVVMPTMFAFFAPSSPLYSVGVGGLAERAFFGIFFVWFAVTGWFLFRYGKLAVTPT